MAAEDHGDVLYTPHPHAESLRLQPLPAPQESRSTSSNLLQWIRGPSDMGDPLDADTVLGPCTARWQAKWDYFQSTYPDQDSSKLMTRPERLERVRWLEADLDRVWSRLSEVAIKDHESEIYAGSMFIGNLMDEVRPWIAALLNQLLNADEGNDNEEMEQVKRIEIVHQFALQSFNHVLILQQEKTLREWKQKRNTSTNKDGNQVNSRRIAHSRSPPSLDGISPSSFNTYPQQNNSVTYFPQPQPQSLPQSQPLPQPQTLPQNHDAPFTFPGQAQHMQPSHPQQFNPPGANEAMTVPRSSASLHKANLGVLLGISFFGASISWSTVFSGTRGDLVIVSWAASVFIVGAVCAASGTALVETDDNIMTRFIQVRWVVRILTVLAVLHVFTGMMLVSVAILLLDVNEDQPEPGTSESGSFRREGTKSAGVFALCVSSIVVLLVFCVKRRYSTRTWFV